MANPVLKSDTFERGLSSEQPMTINGAIGKTVLLLGICAGTAAFAWGSSPTFLYGGMIVGIILALILAFKPTLAPVLAPVYAAAEGVFIGSLSAIFEGSMQGIVTQALALTAGVFCAMLGAYQMRLIRPTKKFMAVVTGATLGIMLFYVASIAMSAFGMKMPIIHDGPYTILFSLFVCGIAALNLIIDFGLIEEGAEVGAPKYMEWYAGFALLVTLVWLYIEILRLLYKLRRD